MLIEHSLFLRPEEVGYQRKSDAKNFYDESVTWHSNFEDPQEISIKVDASKTNRWKYKMETIYTHCKCDESMRITPRPVRLLKHWINMRNAHQKIQFKSNNFTSIHKIKNLFKCRGKCSHKNEYKIRSLEL